MQDYLRQLAQRVQQPELVVQPRPLSLFESPRYSSESLDVDRREEHESQVSPTAGLRTNLDEWTDHSAGKNHDESETAGVMPDAGLPEKRGQLGPRESVDSHADRMDPDHELWRMGEDLAREKPAIEPYQEVVRGERESIEPPVRKEQSVREPFFSLSPEPGESSAHAKQVVETEHEPKQRSHKLESSARRKRTEKQEPAIRSAREQNEPRASMVPLRRQEPRVTPTPRIAPVREETSFDDGRTKMEKLESAIQSVQEQGEPIPGEISFNDTSFPQRLSSGRKSAARADVTPILSRERRTAFAEPVLSLHGGEQSAPSPTIQVSIGRIEVRAITASIPSKKLQAKSSAMSLDEYLTRRSERRR